MLLPWQDELAARFGMVVPTLDKDYPAKVRPEPGFGVNPWQTHSRFLIPHRPPTDESYQAQPRDWLGALRPGSPMPTLPPRGPR